MSKKEESRKTVVEDSAVIAEKAHETVEPAAHPEPLEQDCHHDGNQDEIAGLAYQLWQQRGCPIGSDQEDWFRAENELNNRK